MTDVQQVAVWPASVRSVIERKETPYKFLDANAGMVARAAWWLLNKLGALRPFFESVQRWEYVPHNQAPLHEAMMKAIDYDLRYIENGKAVFIIGGQTFSELVSAPAFRDQMRFMTGPFYLDGGSRDPYHGRRMFDVPVHVVPGMVGMAVVPRVIIEKRKV